MILAVHEDVLLLPVAAVVETEDGNYCWVSANGESVKRSVELGDSNDVFIEVLSGLAEGEEVVLNPAALVEEAAEDALATLSSDSDGNAPDSSSLRESAAE